MTVRGSEDVSIPLLLIFSYLTYLTGRSGTNTGMPPAISTIGL